MVILGAIHSIHFILLFKNCAKGLVLVQLPAVSFTTQRFEFAEQLLLYTMQQSLQRLNTCSARHQTLRALSNWPRLRVTLPHIHRRCLPASIVCMAKVWRPTIDDVDRISRGDAAKVRGTGSRQIPHRLNAEERTLYEQAKKKVRTSSEYGSKNLMIHMQ